MKQRQTPIKQPVRVISSQLMPGVDDDLIEWWDGLEQGQGSREIRAALRAYIGQKPTQDAHTNRLEQVCARLEALARQGFCAPAKPADDQSGLSANELESRRQNLLKRKW